MSEFNIINLKVLMLMAGRSSDLGSGSGSPGPYKPPLGFIFEPQDILVEKEAFLLVNEQILLYKLFFLE